MTQPHELQYCLWRSFSLVNTSLSGKKVNNRLVVQCNIWRYKTIPVASSVWKWRSRLLNPSCKALGGNENHFLKMKMNYRTEMLMGWKEHHLLWCVEFAWHLMKDLTLLTDVKKWLNTRQSINISINSSSINISISSSDINVSINRSDKLLYIYWTQLCVLQLCHLPVM